MNEFKTQSSKLILFSLLSLALLVTPGLKTAWAGFGISSPYVKNDHLTPGSHYEKQIILSRGDPFEDWQATVKFNLGEIESWFKIDKGKEFILPAGQQQVPLIISVDVPKDARYGEYKGSITIETKSLKPPAGGTVAIALGGQIDIDIKVTKGGYFDFLVLAVKSTDFEEGFRNLFGRLIPSRFAFLIQIENKGNIKGAPTKVTMDIYDTQEKMLLQSLETRKIETVEPFKVKWINAYFKTNLPAGSYWAHYRIYKNEEIANEGKIHLSILRLGETRKITFLKRFLATPELYLPILVLIVSGVIFWILKRRKA